MSAQPDLANRVAFPSSVRFDPGYGTISASAVVRIGSFPEWLANYSVAAWNSQPIAVTVTDAVFGADLWRRDWGGGLFPGAPSDLVVLAHRVGAGSLVIRTFADPLGVPHSVTASFPLPLANVIRPLDVVAMANQILVYCFDETGYRAKCIVISGANMSSVAVYDLPVSGFDITGRSPGGVRVIMPADESERACVFLASPTSAAACFHPPGVVPGAPAVAGLGLEPLQSYAAETVDAIFNPMTGRLWAVHHTLGPLNRVRVQEFAYGPLDVLIASGSPTVIATPNPHAVRGCAFPNGETMVVYRTATGLTSSSLLASWGVVQTLGTTFWPAPTPFRGGDGRFHAGVYAANAIGGETTLTLYHRPLAWPLAVGWDAASRMLHLEGPARRGSQIVVAFDFPEVDESGSLCAQAHFTTRQPIQDAPQVLRNASFTVAFSGPHPMDDSSYRFGQPDQQIRLYDAGGGEIPIDVGSVVTTASTVTFAPTGSLTPDSDYQIGIGTGVRNLVVGGAGCELWSPATFAFRTEPAVSSLLAAEVGAWEVFADAALTVPIASGSDFPASAPLFLRLSALIDPSPNSRDVSTATIWVGGDQVATVPLTQPVPSSLEFRGMASFLTMPSLDNPVAIRSLVAPTKRFELFQSFPRVAALDPASGSTGVNLTRQIRIDLTEALATGSVTAASVTMMRNSLPASYTLSFAGSRIGIDPDDWPGGWLRPATSYRVTITPSITDVVGNPLVNPNAKGEAVQFSFTTQPAVTPPTTITGLEVFRDAGLTASWSDLSFVAADATLHLVARAADLSTVTADLSTATVEFSWGPTRPVTLTETALNSGQFVGQFPLPSVPVFGFPGPLPPGDTVTVTIRSATDPSQQVRLRSRFPRWNPATSRVTTIGGPALASAAVGVRIDTIIEVGFDPPCAPVVPAGGISLRVGATDIPFAAEFAPDGARLSIRPITRLPPASVCEVSMGYGAGQLAGPEGNPLAGPVSFQFTTQDPVVPPLAVESLRVFRDPALILPVPDLTFVPGTATLHLVASAPDRSPATVDVSTASVIAPWGPTLQVSLTETAMNSGQFAGTVDLNQMPVYGFPEPRPPGTIATLTIRSDTDPSRTSRVRCRFPTWDPTTSRLATLAGWTAASGAVAVRRDSPIELGFDPPCAPRWATGAVIVTANGVPVPVAGAFSPDGVRLTLRPVELLPVATVCEVQIQYGTGSLQGPEGNPPAAPAAFRFTTQAPITPPSAILRFAAYRSASYEAGDLIPPGTDLGASATVFLEAVGIDGSDLTVDAMLASTSIGPVALTETASASGVFRGAITLSGYRDDAWFTAAPAPAPTLAASFPVRFLHPTPVVPTPGAIGVSVATPIEIELDRDPDLAGLPSATLQVLAGGVEVPCAWAWRSTDRRLVGNPSAVLPLASLVTVRVGGLRTAAGNPQLGALDFAFRTQSAVVEPLVIDRLSVHASDSWNLPLASGSAVGPGMPLYVELLGVDRSPTTVDLTTVRWATDHGVSTLSAVETAADSGRFRIVSNAPAVEDAVLTISSVVDPSRAIGLRTQRRPRWVGRTPVDAAVDVPLDQAVTLTADKPLAVAASTGGWIQGFADGAAVPAVVTASGTNTLVVSLPLASQTTYLLRTTAAIVDRDGLPLPETALTFTTRVPRVDAVSASLVPGGMPALTPGSEVIPGQVIHAFMTGSDLRPSLLESSPLLAEVVGEGGPTVMMLPEIAPGSFRGQLTVPDRPGRTLRFSSGWTASASLELTIRGDFRVLSTVPADGEIWVPADLWPVVRFSAAVATASVEGRVTLVELPVRQEFPTSLEVRGSRVTVVPDRILTLSADFELQIATGIRSVEGEILRSPLTVRFNVQPPPPPPTQILSLLNFRDADYATPTFFPLAGRQLFLEMVANDPSPVTRQTARVRVESTGWEVEDLDLTLVESASASARYRLMTPVPGPVGTQLVVRPMADRSRELRLTVVELPRFLNLQPASGSTGLFLDQELRLTFSNPLSPGGFANRPGVAARIPSGPAVAIESALEASGDMILRPVNQWATGAVHLITLDGMRTDAYGWPLPAMTFRMATRGEGSASLDISRGTEYDPVLSVTRRGELPVGPAALVATTTRLFQARPEFRSVEIGRAGASATIELQAGAAGLFVGSWTVPAPVGATWSAVLAFANRPRLDFVVAPAPVLLAVSPASGAVRIPRTPVLTASFSRPIVGISASDALTLTWPNGAVVARSVRVASLADHWEWISPTLIPPETRVLASLSADITDAIGSPLANPLRWSFTTEPASGPPPQIHELRVFEDASYTRAVTNDIVATGVVFIELVGDPVSGVAFDVAGLVITRELASAAAAVVELRETRPDSGVFRGRVDLLSLPIGPVGVGEWVELASRETPTIRRRLHYLVNGPAPPQEILAVDFYEDPHFRVPVGDAFHGRTLYVRVLGADRNPRTIDRAGLQCRSDRDPVGIELAAIETGGAATGDFRTSLQLDVAERSNPIIRRLLARPGDAIEAVSTADARMRDRVRWEPKNRIDRIAVVPSPCRGPVVWFTWRLTFPADVALRILDVAGDDIAEFQVRSQEGENRFPWRLPARLANGVYFYRVELLPTFGFENISTVVRGKFAVLR